VLVDNGAGVGDEGCGNGEKVRAILPASGQRLPVGAGYIAATARRHGLTIVTGNERDFKRPGLQVFNPFNELA
jgi:predicted nucleic acid-binding protein